MDERFWTPFTASLLAAAVTTAGLWAIRAREDWARRNTGGFACFAAGVLVSVSFLHIVPTAFAMTPAAPVWLLVGYVALHVFNRFLAAHVCDRPETAHYAIGLVPLIGIGIHSFVDGVVYSVTFSVSVFTGVLATIGMVLHEFPEGIVTYLLMLRGGFTKKSAFVFAFLAAAATTPLGTLLSFPLVSRIGTPLLGALLSLSAGALIYVGATHLLPRSEQEPTRHGLLAFAGGVLVAIGIIAGKG